MYEDDREAYLAFAKSLQMDFHFLSEIIDGRRQASAELARALSGATNTWDRLWTAEGKAAERLITVRVWFIKHKRQPGYQTREPEPRHTRSGCRRCD